MIHNPLTLCAAVLAASCFVGSPAPVFAQPLPCDFAAKVHFLAPGVPYDPSSLAPPPQGAPVGQPYAGDLNQAFVIAPAAFQARLCGLDGVFIDPTACSTVEECIGRSWGLRVRNPSAGGGRYIAISAALWNGRPDYGEFADTLLHALLPLNSVSYGDANPGADTFAMSVLAALAHEMGHVRWYDIIDPGRVGARNFNAFCGGSFFVSWAGGAAQRHRPPEWRRFLKLSERQNQQLPDAHRSGLHVHHIDDALSAPLRAGDLLEQIYMPAAPWASFFAAISPDEDFAETYKFKVLTSASPPLTSLPIAIPGTGGIYRENIPAAYSRGLKQELATKLGCIPL
jgi:hypothetical protein